MSIKFEKLRVGGTYYDRHKYRMGNTVLWSIGEWPVEICEISPVRRAALVRWNGNPPRWWRESRLTKLYTWSMSDECAVVTYGSGGAQVLAVKRKVQRPLRGEAEARK